MTTLNEELKTKVRITSLQQEVFLSLLVTVDRLHRHHGDFMSGFGISQKQYNILRILRGAGKPGLPVMEIGRRMIEKSPDVSRIIDRLIESGLVKRRRQRQDRRVVLVTISAKGLTFLDNMEQPVAEQVDSMLEGMREEDLKKMLELLDRARDALYRNHSKVKV